MPFRVPKIQWQNMLRMALECISYNLEFQNFPGEDLYPPPTREGGALPHLCRGARFVPPALNSPPTL